MSDTETRGSEATQEKSGIWTKSKSWLLKLVVVFAVTYGLAAGFMYLNQRNFVFVPTGQLATPEDKGLETVSAEVVEMADGTKITVWTAEPSVAEAPTVLYFHGNSNNLSGRWQRFKQILDSGYGLYAPTHRGYAGAEGSPSEAALISDAFEHYDRVAAGGSPVIVHGESLGTGLATAVAAERPDAGLLVLEAPYTALVDIAAEQYPWLPVALLMKDPMITRDRIGNVEIPVLILHGTEDRIIPVEHGRRLFEHATEPKELFVIEGAGHGDLWKSGLWDAVKAMWNRTGS